MKSPEYNQCVDLYADRLYRYASRMLGDRTEAEDIVQLVFERFWLKHADVAFEKAKSYLFTSVYRACIDLIRKRKRSPFVEQAEIPDSEGHRSAGFELRDAIQRALEKLPVTQRTLILLRDYEGYAYEEIAEMTALSISKVKVYLFRARKKLQKELAYLRQP